MPITLLLFQYNLQAPPH